MIRQALGRITTATKAVTNRQFDALDLLRSDHMKAEAMLLQLRIIRDAEHRATLFRQIRADLEKHMRIEEEEFYPACREVSKLKGLVGHSYEEHGEARAILKEMAAMEMGSTAFSRKVTQLIKSIEHHVMEEENRLFPQVRKSMSEADFRRLSRTVVAAHAEKRARKSRRAA